MANKKSSHVGWYILAGVFGLAILLVMITLISGLGFGLAS